MNKYHTHFISGMFSCCEHVSQTSHESSIASFKRLSHEILFSDYVYLLLDCITVFTIFNASFRLIVRPRLSFNYINCGKFFQEHFCCPDIFPQKCEKLIWGAKTCHKIWSTGFGVGFLIICFRHTPLHNSHTNLPAPKCTDWRSVAYTNNV